MAIANLESTLIAWSKRSSDTEEQKCENALNMITAAIKGYDKFNDVTIEFIQQGSYYNNTNVRLNSDVDICVKLTSTVFTEYPEGMGDSDFGLVAGTYNFADYVSDIEAALVKKFGRR